MWVKLPISVNIDNFTLSQKYFNWRSEEETSVQGHILVYFVVNHFDHYSKIMLDSTSFICCSVLVSPNGKWIIEWSIYISQVWVVNTPKHFYIKKKKKKLCERGNKIALSPPTLLQLLSPCLFHSKGLDMKDVLACNNFQNWENGILFFILSS